MLRLWSNIVVFGILWSCAFYSIGWIRVVRASDDVYHWLKLGDDALSQGQVDAAISFYQQGIDRISKEKEETNDAMTTILSLYTNLGTAQSTRGDTDAAIAAYRQALKFYQSSAVYGGANKINTQAREIAAQASFFLGMVFQDLKNQPRYAVEAYLYATELDPFHWAAYANLGAVQQDQLRNHSAAFAAYEAAFELLTLNTNDVTDPPEDMPSILSQLQYRIGLCLSQDLSNEEQPCILPDGNCRERAAHALSRALDYDPQNEAAQHMLATLTADATLQRASNLYVQELFDHYAENFEESLVQELSYTGFERLRRGFDRAMLNSTVSEDEMFDVVLDAGCGTGLAGEQFRNISRTLMGVDLSAAILEQAVTKRPGLYDAVIVGDVTQVLREKKPISLIIAADSFIYFGDLDPLFDAIQEGLDDERGYIAFTLENVENEAVMTEAKPDWRWQLTASGRFAHRKDYVIQAARKHGLELIYYEAMGKSSGFDIVIFHLFLNQASTDVQMDFDTSIVRQCGAIYLS
jgi:predicted TPR repeat methyltransferase